MARYAVIDCGTNSVKCLIAEDAPRYNELADQMIVTRLGEGLYRSNTLSRNAMQRTLEAINQLTALAAELDADSITLAGTMALRSAYNAKEFIEQIIADTGITPVILSGAVEARLSYSAAVQLVPDTSQQSIVFDTGGGSTECIVGTRQQILKRVSIDMGAVQPTESCILCDPPSDAEFKAMKRLIYSTIASHAPVAVPDCLVGIGGTVTTLAAMHLQMEQFEGTRIHGCSLQKTTIDELIYSLRNMSHEKRIMVPGLHPKRADIILSGATIVQQIMHHYHKPALTVSNHGLRHALWQAVAHNQSLQEE